MRNKDLGRGRVGRSGHLAGLVATLAAAVAGGDAQAAPVPAGAAGVSQFPKPPPFDEALAAAKQAGKPLVIDFGAEWCEPCKQLEAELTKPQGQTALQDVYFVRYDVDQAPGMAVRERFAVTSYPTLLAVDPEGNEVERRSGFGDFAVTRAWLQRMPEVAIGLDACVSRANHEPKNLSLQFQAGKRLASARRWKEALPYFTRARAADDPQLAASASWGLAEADVTVRALPVRRRHAERLAARYPSTPEGLRALRFLATLPDPPRALVGQVITQRATAGTTGPAELEELTLYGLRAGAVAAAGKAALLLEPLAQKDPPRLLTVAEAAFAQGDRDHATRLAQQSLATATGLVREAAEKTLARFEKGDPRPSPAVAALSADGAEGRRGEMRPPPAWLSVAPQLTRQIGEDCAPAGASLGEVHLRLLSGLRPEDLVVMPEQALPADVQRCIDRTAQKIGIPANQSFALTVALDPPALGTQLTSARKAASDCLPPPRKGERVEPVEALLTAQGSMGAAGAPGGGQRVRIADGQPELLACLERAFAQVELPAGTARALHVMPARPKPDKPEAKTMAGTSAKN